MPQGARDGGVAMYRMYGMPQGAKDGECGYVQNVRYVTKNRERDGLMFLLFILIRLQQTLRQQRHGRRLHKQRKHYHTKCNRLYRPPVF